jgi:hypothetical protein
MANLLAEYEARPGRAMKLFSCDVFRQWNCECVSGRMLERHGGGN